MKFKVAYFLVVSFLPLTKVVDVEVRFTAPLEEPLLNDMDWMDEKPFMDWFGLKKSSTNETPINGFMNDVKMLLFCGCECRWPPLRRLPAICPKSRWNGRSVVWKFYLNSILHQYSTYRRQKIQQRVNLCRKIPGTLRRVNGTRSQNLNPHSHDDDLGVIDHYVQANLLCHIDRRFVFCAL